MKTALLFAGQGSQYVGMMRPVFEQFSTAAALISRADELLGFSISSICFDGPADTLKETRYTQPALFVHEAAILAALDGRLPFDAAAGHSLGEYSALYAAGVLSFDDALRLVALRGKLMFAAGESEPGAMAAVIGLADEKVLEICAELTGNEGVVVAANFNSPGQIVISGTASLVRNNLHIFKQAGARMVTELPVSGAFHSPLMAPAQRELAEALRHTPFSDANVDVLVNVTAQPEHNGNALRERLIEQLVSPVLWTQTMLALQQHGIAKVVEIGPGKVLQGLAKRTLQGVEIKGVDTADDVAAILAG
jgi:[acyl-carrier-protein] S-malonyltransferase